MTTIKKETTSNVLKVHFYVKCNILMVLSESKLSLLELKTLEIADLKAIYVVYEVKQLSPLFITLENSSYCTVKMVRSF